MNEPVCIFCKKNSFNGEDHILTDDHIIPKVIGGWLTSPFVCKKCNNKIFGSQFEADLKKNGYIAAALDILHIQEKKIAYKAANLKLLFPSKSEKLDAYFDEKGITNFHPKELKDKSLLTSEKDAQKILAKKIIRFEKEHNIKINFNLDDYIKFPYNIVIPVNGTDISFIKTRDEKADLFYENLNKPISFLLPAKISLVLLSRIDYTLTMSSSLDPFRNWVLSNNENTFILLHSFLNKTNPFEVPYLPNHFIKYSFYAESLVAVVGIFGIFKFSVFLGKLKNIVSPNLSAVLDKYIIFDLTNNDILLHVGDDVSIKKDKTLLESIAQWGLIRNKL